MACTTILVGKDASYDGSTIIARNEDSANGEFCPKRFIVVKPDEQPRHYKSVLSHVEVDLPDEPLQYTAVPNADLKEGIWGEAGVNEANVAMSATETLTTNERVLGADPFVELTPAKGKEGEDGYEPEVPGGIGEEDFLTLVLPYVKTAREGVTRLGALLEQYGTYEMNGVAFSDVDEIWWLETVGGHHWIAKRVPDDCYAVIANQLGIDHFDLDDAEGEQRDFMCSPDLREFVEKNHLDLTVRAPGERVSTFNPRDAFGSHADRDYVYNTPRTWDMQRHLNPKDGSHDGICPEIGPESDANPWCRVPARKITVEDVKYVLSLHYQGTPFDPYGKDAVLGKKYRPIAINRNGVLSVMQIRPYEPEASRALHWLTLGCNAYNTLVPLFANVDAAPAYLATTPDLPSTESFYWTNRLIAAMADAHHDKCIDHVERYCKAAGGRFYQILHEADARVREGGLSYSEATPVLEEANDRLAQALRELTDDLLDKVLFTTSMNMRLRYSRSDA